MAGFKRALTIITMLFCAAFTMALLTVGEVAAGAGVIFMEDPSGAETLVDAHAEQDEGDEGDGGSSEGFTDHKAVIMIGAPYDWDFSWLIEEADRLEELLRSYGIEQVIKYVTPECRWSRVRRGLQDANLVIYMGHGHGYNEGEEYEESARNGFLMDYDPTFPCGPDPLDRQRRNGCIGRAVIQADIELAPGAMVVLNHACYAAGSSTGDPPDLPLKVAKRRVQEYSATFLEMGASYYATNYWHSPRAFLENTCERGYTLEQARDIYCWAEEKHYFNHPAMEGATFSFGRDYFEDGGYGYGEAFAGYGDTVWGDYFPPDDLADRSLSRQEPGAEDPGGLYDEYLLVSNPGDEDALVRLEFHKPGGDSYDEITVGAGERETVEVDRYAGREDVSIRLLSDHPVAAERAMYVTDPGGGRGGSCASGAVLSRDEWYFAEGYTGPGFDEYILVFNPGKRDVIARLTLYPAAGEQRDFSRELASGERWTVRVNDVPGFDCAELSARVSSEGGGVVAERSMYLDSGDVTGCHGEQGVPWPSSTWYFAEGYVSNDDNGQFETYFLVLNPNPEPVAATIELSGEDGSTSAGTFELAPNSRFTVVASDIRPGGGAFSAVVFAEMPVVVERAMYFDYYGVVGGHCAAGADCTSRVYHFAEGYTGGGYDTYLLLYNPGESMATVTVRYNLEPDYGDGFSKTCYVAPRTRLTVKADDEAPAASLGFTVESDTDLVAERAMYFRSEKDGVHSAVLGGHDTFGTELLDQVWYFAEGYTGG